MVTDMYTYTYINRSMTKHVHVYYIQYFTYENNNVIHNIHGSEYISYYL